MAEDNKKLDNAAIVSSDIINNTATDRVSYAETKPSLGITILINTKIILILKSISQLH